MHPIAKSALIRLAWIVAAVAVASAVLQFAFVQWRDTEYGNTSQYLDKTDVELWLQALGMSVGVVGGVLLANAVLTFFVTNRYPIGRWSYWVSFVVIAVSATVITRVATTPISDAGFAFIALSVCALVTIICLVIGTIETLVHVTRNRSASA